MSTSVQPEDSPAIVALVPSVSSASKVLAASPLRVTLEPPLHTVVAPNTGASATPVADTVRTSTALAVAPPSLELTVRVRNALSPPRSGAVTTRSPRSAAAKAWPLLSTAAPSPTVQPAGIPDRVALSVSSASPVAESPASVIPASSLPCHTVVAPNTGASATPLADTLRTSTALVVAPPSLELTVKVRNALSPPRSGAVTTRSPRSAAAKAWPLLSTAAPSLTVQPAGIPDRVALSVSSASPVAESPASVIPASSLPLHTVVAPNTGASATPLAVTLRTSTALAVAPPSLELTVRVRNALSPPRSGAVTTRSPRSAAANASPLLSTAPPSLTVQPAGIPLKVALSVSSASPVAESPASVIPASSLPCHTVVAPNTGASATPLAVTLRTSTALAVAPPSLELTVRVRNALSPPLSGAVT